MDIRISFEGRRGYVGLFGVDMLGLLWWCLGEWAARMVSMSNCLAGRM